MKIAILGAGAVGQALGGSLAKAGHEVRYGLRDPAASKYESIPAASKQTMPEAAAWADVAVLATAWGGAEPTVKSCAAALAGKLLLDLTNPIKGRLEGLDPGGTSSGGEAVAGWAPEAKVVKVFNTTGLENMKDPTYGDQKSMMPVASDDQAAKELAIGLAKEIGFDAFDGGPLRNARYLEPLAMVWIWMAVMGGQGRNFAFTVARR